MKILIFIVYFGILARLARLPLFETVFAVLLASPPLFFLAGIFSSDFHSIYYLLVLGWTLVLLFFAFTRRNLASERKPILGELEPLAVFVLGALFFHFFCLSWPNFYSIGERMRDYALLASVLQSPIFLEEPWLSGVELNYYAYWYRFGHMMSTMLELEVWETYHQLQAFTYGLFFASSFRLLRSHLRLPLVGAFLCSVFVALGSNVAGITHWFNDGGSWWNASRVIKGAIHEFPAWSFLLGDLHPHYLNLGVLPFFFTLVLALKGASGKKGELFALWVSLLLLPCLMLYNSNLWELPIWLGFIVVLLCAQVAAALYSVPYSERVQDLRSWLMSLRVRDVLLSTMREGIAPGFLLLVCTSFGVAVGLLIMGENFRPIDSSIALVKHPVLRSRFVDLCQHWGLPLFLIAAANLTSVRLSVLRVVSVALLFTVILFADAIFFLTVLWLINLYRVFDDLRLRKNEGQTIEFRELVLESFGVGGIGLVLVPEIIFLNDPYGGDMERMNTIFKLYSANWVFLHVFAFYLVRKVSVLRIPLPRLSLVGQGAMLALLSIFLLFFIKTTGERRDHFTGMKPFERGLSRVNQLYPGSGPTIMVLADKKRGVVLEGEGSAYSETTLVATLAAQRSYLGWVNHVHLLYPDQKNEIVRREAVTKEFYTVGDCERKRALLRKEGIHYAVVGTLEKRRYKELDLAHYQCLDLLYENAEYRLYGP